MRQTDYRMRDAFEKKDINLYLRFNLRFLSRVEKNSREDLKKGCERRTLLIPNDSFCMVRFKVRLDCSEESGCIC